LTSCGKGPHHNTKIDRSDMSNARVRSAARPKRLSLGGSRSVQSAGTPPTRRFKRHMSRRTDLREHPSVVTIRRVRRNLTVCGSQAAIPRGSPPALPRLALS
jgi:hypothetical protein